MSSEHIIRMLDELSNEELMLRYASKNDLDAFELIVNRLQNGIFFFAKGIVHDDGFAEEITQETFVALVKMADHYEPTAKLTTLAYNIAKRRCIDVLRKKREKVSTDQPVGNSDSRTTMIELVADDMTLDAIEIADQKAFASAAGDAIEALPDDQKQVFLLKYIDCLSFREIGEALEIPEGTAKSRMRLALQRLRDSLSEFGILIESGR